MEQKLINAAAGLPETELAFEDLKIPETPKRRFPRPIPALALCLALLLCGGFGTLAYAAEARPLYETILKAMNEADQ